MKQVLLHIIPATAATLILTLQPVAGQERSEEYEQGYNDARCDMFREMAPLLLMLAPRAVVSNPETIADFMATTEECGIDWAAMDSETATEPPAAEPGDLARCQRLAGLIAPLDVEIDRLLAAAPSSATSLEIVRTQRRRDEIENEMRRAGC